MLKLNLFILFAIFTVFLFGNLNQCATAEGKKYNRYLTYLFKKYGNGATITFEGLEHLMDNLGIGDLEFAPAHTIEEHFPTGYIPPEITSDEDVEIQTQPASTESQKRHVIEYNDELQISTNEVDFKEMHDPKHFHPKHTEKYDHHDHGHSHGNVVAFKKPARICLPPRGILHLLTDDSATKSKTSNYENDSDNLTSVKITPSEFLKICPALLIQLDQQICTENGLPHKNMDVEKSFNSSEFAYACLYASISIFILSASGLCGILVVPLMKSFVYNEILKFLVAVAVGTLGGDALMHLIPHALLVSNSGEGVDQHLNSILIFGCSFLTVIFMYCIESFLPLIRGTDSHSHGHSHGEHKHHNHHKNVNGTVKQNELEPNAEQSTESNSTMLDENKLDVKEKTRFEKPMTPVAFMVVIGDGLHNLTDGLAIGAAFAADPVTGMATAFAVLCHELPHELGDFALLIQTGLSVRRAVYLNIVSSVLSFVGMSFGLVIAGMHGDMVKWIYACTAGSFLYIALTDLIPELEKSGKSLVNSLIQILGILCGGLIMLLIALHEDSLRIWFQ